MILAAFFLNLAGAIFCACGAFMAGAEALQSFQNGNIVAGFANLFGLALAGFCTAACVSFALYGEDA